MFEMLLASGGKVNITYFVGFMFPSKFLEARELRFNSQSTNKSVGVVANDQNEPCGGRKEERETQTGTMAEVLSRRSICQLENGNGVQMATANNVPYMVNILRG